MDDSALLLLLLNFVFIGALPRLFFRSDGSFNLKWWLTALPFFLCPLYIAAGLAIGWQPFFSGTPRTVLTLASVVLSVASIALIFMTLGTHRIPLALWHQDNDAPQHIVTYGAYRRIRHPFYSSFLLAFLAGLLVYPHWGTVLLAVYGLVSLNTTAAREERRLSASEFGAEYRRYINQTGRFLPRLGRIEDTAGPARPVEAAQVAEG
ncbi:methyltransferase family protein [Streptantibioticus rubrisoli]|uniref:Isoprenylcysteine carboxylmethyltransferase family protein n=1 Tax=Streptantibioticus rubrisoli TaxID=1387313 RepID=A0ABT1P8X2_9ACTN|nr:isoprenylcysteine carboxylmethyltransferase family protein [Streptantibioticus rubrisoli]MCQ4040708.1 isoprenylcysteine carboxylmethyltransferase family protein [Streptantibioticus rubrisoli]